jgi:hypothetical protein
VTSPVAKVQKATGRMWEYVNQWSTTLIQGFIHSVIYIPWILTWLEKPVDIEIVKDKCSYICYISTDIRNQPQ